MLISFGVTAKLICVFVFAYAECWFSHDAAHFCAAKTALISLHRRAADLHLCFKHTQITGFFQDPAHLMLTSNQYLYILMKTCIKPVAQRARIAHRTASHQNILNSSQVKDFLNWSRAANPAVHVWIRPNFKLI